VSGGGRLALRVSPAANRRAGLAQDLEILEVSEGCLDQPVDFLRSGRGLAPGASARLRTVDWSFAILMESISNDGLRRAQRLP